jgi:hypothetical protein
LQCKAPATYHFWHVAYRFVSSFTAFESVLGRFNVTSHEAIPAIYLGHWSNFGLFLESIDAFWTAEGRQSVEGRGERAEGRGQRAEGRGQRAEGRGQRAEVTGCRTEGAGRRVKRRYLFNLSKSKISTSGFE